MYADKITNSMEIAINETKRRREQQEAYNEKHGITPKTINKRSGTSSGQLMLLKTRKNIK